MTRVRVLVGDDKENIRKLFVKILGETCDVVTVGDGTRLLATLEASDFDVVVTDIRMPGADGFTVLQEVRRSHPDVEVILMTAYASVAKAVEAMKEGAYDYLAKPFEPDEALVTVERAAERKRLREQAKNLSRALEEKMDFKNFVGRSSAMRKVFDLMQRAAATDATVLVTGESGTGKELVARGIHSISARKAGRFVPINCGAIPEALMESELFGHARGAFTGAVARHAGLLSDASGGTVFFDEVAELPLGLQVKLTRALQERSVRPVGSTLEVPVDVRVIAATNVDLKIAVAEKRFREDLYYRLNVFRIQLPPLRDRREDVPALATHFLRQFIEKLGSKVEGFEQEALVALARYDWPGNVRELENAVERAVAVGPGPRLHLEAFPEEITYRGRAGFSPDRLTSLSYRAAIDLAKDRVSREYLVSLMKACEGNVTKAAERAQVKRESLHRLLKRHQIHPEEFRTIA
ncbi:MAG: sigma-54-dependent Fis family transcriptional regulator [Gemmatimonadales bacterium]|nr:MAG: sigma-54-dependent Fis family transcriptional regulator [Gemmatimonadales bacterium]